jgi:hypothetical protein
MSLPLDLRGLDPDGAGLNGVNLHGCNQNSKCADFAVSSL